LQGDLSQLTTVLFRCLVVAALAAAPDLAQTEVGGEGLTARAEITEQKYCLGEPLGGSFVTDLRPDAITLQLTTVVSYRNVSTHSIIYLVNPDAQIVLSHNLDDATQRKHQTLLRLIDPQPRSVLRDPSYFESERPNAGFFILGPTSSGLSVRYTAILQVHNPSHRGTDLRGKTVFFQLDLNFARIPDQTARDLESRWRPYGVLWAGRIRTQPIEISIPKDPKAFKCLSELKID
jgi:hypothetical protein